MNLKRDFHLLSVFLFFQLFSADLPAQPSAIARLDGSTITPARIDSVVSRLMTGGRVEGLQLAILNQNKPVYIKSYGFRNRDRNERLNPASVMYSASFSKAVFGYLALKLVQEGIIELDKPLHQYLPKPIPEYSAYTDLKGDERWKLITARFCLSHSSGLPNSRWLNVLTGELDTVGLLRIYSTPGTRYSYSGEGLKLLQLTLETITGKNLEQLAEQYVFEPIGMTHTSYIWQNRFDSNYAAGHDEAGKAIDKQRPKTPSAQATMFTTITDFAKFSSYIMQGKGLSPFFLKEMSSAQIRINSTHQFPTLLPDTTDRDSKVSLSYGLCWGTMITPAGKAFFKEGHDDAWRNYTINFPEKGISIIVMCNSANGEGIFKELLESLIGDVYTPWEWERYIPYTSLTAVSE